MSFIKNHPREVLIAVLIILNAYILYFILWSEDKALTVYFLNVGQGDGILIKSPSGNKMLIDSGPGGTTLEELSKILPFHDKKLEVVLSTHPDKDHIGGLSQILNRFDVTFLIDPNVPAETRTFEDSEEFILRENLKKRFVAERGMVVNLGEGVKFTILFPDRDVSGLDPNDASIIGKLTFGDTSFLLSGDSPQKIEEYLVFLDGSFLQSDVLKAGHHGSRTSSSPTFVETVSPDYAVIQAGKDNSYGHPHEEVLEILKNQNAQILSNADLGTIIFKSDAYNIQVSYEK